MTPDKKRRHLFLALIDALLEHVQMNTRMDIRDRIAALALVDRVLAREKSDVDAERAGSKVRDTARPSRRPIRLGERQIPDREGGPSPMTSAATTTGKVTIALLNVPHSICDRLRSNLKRSLAAPSQARAGPGRPNRNAPSRSPLAVGLRTAAT